ncbi:LysR family transcriptional regulator [Solicola sp. PLA-1-18]|uniref:LysR family transcriptional regulator n=1 Tax=Solicola sp. PLA-1-18 TaxID=3380532 RepID=UPI003B77885A
MEIHQLRYAVAIADEGSFTAAAAAMHVSQSGVSAQVGRLERELGVTLFDRGPRSVRPTESGTLLVERMRTVLAALADVHATAGEVLGLLRGTVRVGAVAGLGWAPFLDALEHVHSAHPGLDLSLREGVSSAVQEEVADGRLDVAVVSWSGEPLAGLASWVAVHERVAVVVGRHHPWASRTSVLPADLLDAEVVCTSRGTGMRAAYDALMRAEGLPTPVTWEVTLPTTARALVARGLGVGVLTTSHADLDDDLVRVEIRSDHTESMLGVVWRPRPDPSPAAAAVLSALRRHLGPDGP